MTSLNSVVLCCFFIAIFGCAAEMKQKTFLEYVADFPNDVGAAVKDAWSEVKSLFKTQMREQLAERAKKLKRNSKEVIATTTTEPDSVSTENIDFTSKPKVKIVIPFFTHPNYGYHQLHDWTQSPKIRSKTFTH